jgi:Phage integrase family
MQCARLLTRFLTVLGYCFAAAVASNFSSPRDFCRSPQFFRRDWQRSYDHRLTESTSQIGGGARHAGRKRNSRATKTGSRRLVLPMVGIGAGRTSDEVRQLLAALEQRERIMVLLDVATGLRQSELFALKWKDVDFKNKQLWVTRSIVQQVVGSCKTEASQKPVPLHDHLICALLNWRRRTPYRTPESWVFASPQNRGKKPYWGQQLLRHYIRPVAQRLGITKRIGWHTFRRHFSKCLI